MTTIVINENTEEGRYLINVVRSMQKISDAVVSICDEKKQTFAEAAAECNAVSVDTFFDELNRQLKEYYNNA